MPELLMILRELVRIITGYYPPMDEELEETLARLRNFPSII